jgi:hypothetical protein
MKLMVHFGCMLFAGQHTGIMNMVQFSCWLPVYICAAMEAAAAATASMQEKSPANSAMQFGDVSHRDRQHVSTAEVPVRTPTLRFAWSDILGLRGGSMRLAVRADQSKPCATKRHSSPHQAHTPI